MIKDLCSGETASPVGRLLRKCTLQHLCSEVCYHAKINPNELSRTVVIQ